MNANAWVLETQLNQVKESDYIEGIEYHIFESLYIYATW